MVNALYQANPVLECKNSNNSGFMDEKTKPSIQY